MAQKSAALRFIIALGIVSFFADVTYEGARSVVGPFLGGLGASAAQVGLVAGLGEMLAAGLRYFSGRLADRSRAYWAFVFAGYGVNIIAVPALALVGSWQAAALLVAAERIGKSLRGPSRDVLLSGATFELGHGLGFGLHAAMDQAGAVLGPLIVVAVVARQGDYAPAFLVLTVPAVLAVVALVVARRLRPERPAEAAEPPRDHPPRAFWTYVAAAALLGIGFADFALLAFHLDRTALVAAAIIPLLYSLAMAADAGGALLFGRWFDRAGVAAIAAGIAVSALALPLGFLGGGGPALVVPAVLCWGLGMGVMDGTLRAGVARLAPLAKRGTAYGAYNAVFGIAWFAGSVLMGMLYERSRAALVLFGVTAQLLAAVLFLSLRHQLSGRGK